MTNLYQESDKEHNRLIHFSSMILISTDGNWIIMVLNEFKCSVTELKSLILRRYNFFLRNNLFTRNFDWQKIPKLSHSFLANSPKTFNNTKSVRHSQIILIALFSSFSHSSLDITVRKVHGQIAAHYSRSTQISSI
jgi:hypothetical protein